MRDFVDSLSSRAFWASTLRLAVALAMGAALLVLAFFMILVAVPLAIAGGIALHLWLRRARRRAAETPGVIEGEYVIVREERIERDRP